MKTKTSMCIGVLVSISILSACHNGYVFKTKNLQLPSPSSPKVEKSIDSAENAYESCTTQNMEWTAGGIEASLLDPTADWCIPGNVLDAASLSNGKYTALVGERYPLTLVNNCAAFDKTTATVKSPTPATLTEGVNSILRGGIHGDIPADFTMRAMQVNSETDLKLFVGASYAGNIASLSSAFDFSNKSITSRYIVDIAEVYYNIFVDRGKSLKFFRSKPDKWDDKSHPPVYVKQVKYGKRVMIAIESSANDDRTQAELRAKINTLATSASLNADVFSQKQLNQLSVKVMIKGGSRANAYKTFQIVTNHDTLYKLIDKEQWSLKNLGIPLAYKMCNVSDNSDFMMSETGKYVARNCQIKPYRDSSATPAPLEFLRLWHAGGGDRNFGGDPYAQASVKLEIDNAKKNVINAIITSTVTENGGDGTVGYLRTVLPIVSMPANVDILSINSPDQAWVQRNLLQHQGATPFPFTSDESPVAMLSIIGDSPNNNDDDLFPGPTRDDNHCEIRRIEFFPVKFQYTIRKQK